MINIAVIGLGKIGISHLSILNRINDVDIPIVCDSSKFVLSGLKRLSNFNCITDYKKILSSFKIDAVIIATPTILHYEMVKYFINQNVSVFIEKPFCISPHESLELSQLAIRKNLVNQVGYHNRFIGTFLYGKKLLEKNVLGKIYHFVGESYGPVVTKKTNAGWKLKKSMGGGCLYDYASHVINLINYYFGEPINVSGTVLKKIFSKDVEDAVYSTLNYNGDLEGYLAVNWSDNSYRRMSTKITIFGKRGKIIVDSQECRIYLTYENQEQSLEKGWNIRYITDLTESVAFFVRGEEYSAQLDYFVNNIKNKELENINSFSRAAETDKLISHLLKNK